MYEGFTSSSPYPQPISGYRDCPLLHGKQEEIEFLPGTSVRIWYTHRDTCFPEHWHHALEIVEGLHNHYPSVAEEVTYTIEPGDILFMPGGVAHTLSPSPDCNGFVYFMNLDFLQQIKSASRVIAMLAHPILITKKNTPALHLSVSALLTQIREDYFSNNDLRELLIDATTLLMMEKLIHYRLDDASGGHNRYDKRKEYRERFSDVIDYINQHYAEDLTVDGMAKRLGLSRFYFSRLFKQYSLYTFCGYLTMRRVKAAEQMLAVPGPSITDIAYRCGFGSPSSFSRIFHEQKKCSPSGYRQIYRSNHNMETRCAAIGEDSLSAQE